MFPRHLDLGTLGNSGALLTSSPSLPHHPASAQDHSPLSNIPKWVSWPHPRLSESLLGAASSLLHVMHAPPWALVWLLPPTESSCRTGTHLRTPCTPGPAPYIHRVHSWVFSHSVKSNSLRPHRPQPASLISVHGIFLANTGVGFHFLLQETSLTQGLNMGLQHCRQILYCLSYQGSQVAFNKSWENEQITSKCSVC